MITNLQKELISNEVIRVLHCQLEEIIEITNPNQINKYISTFFDSIVDNKLAEISLSSWLHGLNTTLGQNYFENVAHILSNGEKREYTSGKLGNLQIIRTQKNIIGDIITNLSNNKTKPNLVDEDKKIFITDETELVSASDFSADVFIDDGKEIVAIELKTVKPNSGGSRGEKQKMLEGKAALFRKFPDEKIRFFLGFPFDPTNADSDTGYDKLRFSKSVINLSKYFAPEEILLAGELWDFLSGQTNTMEQLIEIINSIATLDFMDKYDFVSDPKNKLADPVRYENILKQWNLYSELKLFYNDENIKLTITNNKSLLRTYNQMIFKDGSYKEDRFTTLSNLTT